MLKGNHTLAKTSWCESKYFSVSQNLLLSKPQKRRSRLGFILVPNVFPRNSLGCFIFYVHGKVVVENTVIIGHVFHMEVSYNVQGKCPFSLGTLKLRHWVTWGEEGAQHHPACLDGAESLSAKGLSLSAKWLSTHHLHAPHGSQKITTLCVLMSGKSQFAYSYCLAMALLGDSLAEFEKKHSLCSHSMT